MIDYLWIIIIIIIVIIVITFIILLIYNYVQTFDIVKYQGKFYQIYKQNAYFEIECQASTAFYELSKDGKKLNVKNTCYSENGTSDSYTLEDTKLKELKSIKGIATPTDDPFIFNIEFEYGQKGIYHIFYTDYEFSIVGNLKTNYLSILSRNPYVSDEKLQKLKNLASTYGFKIEK